MRTGLTILGLVLLVAVAVTVTRLGILYSQVDRYRQYWVAERERSAESGTIRLIALGDSSAQGIGASRPERGYVGLLAESIEEMRNQPVQVINLSVSGATVRDVIQKQLPTLQNVNLRSSDIVVMTIGGNDVVQNTRPESEYIAEDILSLMRAVPQQTIVADIAYFGGGRYKSREQTVQDYNRLIWQAAQDQTLATADLYTVTKQRDNWRVYSADLFHPSDHGYQNWHDAFWPLVQKQL